MISSAPMTAFCGSSALVAWSTYLLFGPAVGTKIHVPSDIVHLPVYCTLVSLALQKRLGTVERTAPPASPHRGPYYRR
jgi:hypothetical protein